MQTEVPPMAPSPSGPPPQRKRPIWLYVLGGCGGCAALLVVVLVIVFGSFASQISKDMGPVNQSSMQQALGPELPVYPGAKYDQATTQAVVVGFRISERLTGKKPGGIFKGAMALRSSDDADKILTFYDKELKSNGWTVAQQRDTGFQEQHVYRKGKDLAIVQVQSQKDEQVISLMRGGPELMSLSRRRRSRGGQDGSDGGSGGSGTSGTSEGSGSDSGSGSSNSSGDGR